MSINNTGVHEYNSEQCREILSNLPDIFAVGLRFDEDQLVEIHVLASIERSPKQISRDIQSALYATYGIEVDHRIISIAQLPQDPFNKTVESAIPDAAPAKEVRLLFNGIDSSQKDGQYQVSVYLSCNGKSYTGRICCRNSESHRNRSIATATLNAVNDLLGCDYFSLLDVKQVFVSDVAISVTVVEYQESRSSTPILLVGAAAQQDSPPTSIVRSTLDALNRCISKLCTISTDTK